jgi:5-dehydro-4-deoxyglucarate dehydratase
MTELRGVLGFPVTPFHDDLSLDLATLERHVDDLARHPYCAQVAVGGGGEVYSLTVAEAIEVVRVTVRVTNGRMPVFGGVGYNAVLGAEMARGMEMAGADGLLVLPPYYTNAPFDGLVAYYQAIGRATGLPLSLYSRDWAVFTPAQVARLADAVPTLKFWKDGQGDIRRYRRIMAAVGDRLTWVGGAGDDCAAGYFAIGCPAYASSVSAIAPRLPIAIAEAGLKRDFDRLDALLTRCVHPLFAMRDLSRGYEVALTKRAMALAGHSAGPVRPPLKDLTAEETARLAEVLSAWGDWL